jgi:hypothetical protein
MTGCDIGLQVLPHVAEEIGQDNINSSFWRERREIKVCNERKMGRTEM